MTPLHGTYNLRPCPTEIEWTPEGLEYETIRRSASRTFIERLQWMEEMLAMMRTMQQSPVLPPVRDPSRGDS